LALGDRQWSEEQIELVRELGDVVGSAIAHVQLYKKWEEASYQAQEASRLKNEFLGTISHELRTPLNKIICSLKLILDDGADDLEEQREFINYAHHSALHLLNLINDILEISKLKSDKIQLDIDPVNFAELLNDLERCMQPQMQEKNLNLLIQNLSHNEIILYGNYRALLQVLLNLVDNAIKFTEEGGITISSRVIFQKVIIHNHDLPGLVEILITDTGIGVSLEKQEKIFTMFTKGDGSRTSSYGGTGLGLTLCQKLLAAMGGEITFSSRGEGLGSTVTFTVPLYQEPVTRSLPNEASEINLLI
jgi:signal transduction histidine kinase